MKSKGVTKRGLPVDYQGDDPDSCNARTKAGGYCRSLALPSGRCKWHGGLSTGPVTAAGKAKAARNLTRKRQDLVLSTQRRLADLQRRRSIYR